MALGAGKGMVSFVLIFPGCPQQVWELLWSRQSYQGQSQLMKCEQHRAALESISHWRVSRFKERPGENAASLEGCIIEKFMSLSHSL